MTGIYAGISRREDDITKDLVLVAIDGTSFKVHDKIIRRKWSNLGRISSPDVSFALPRICTKLHPTILNLFIDYCYNLNIASKVHSSAFTVVEQLLDSAGTLCLNGLIEKVIGTLVEKLSVHNCLTLWKICKRFNSTYSFEVHDFVLYNLVDNINSSLDLLYDWYRLSAGEVAFILADDYLNTRNEQDVWYLACTWMRVDEVARAVHAPSFVRLLRFQSDSELIDFAAHESFGMLPHNFLSIAVVGQAKQRHPRDFVAIFGGRHRISSRHVALTTVEIYDKRTNVWREIESIEGVLNTSHTMTSLGSELYIMEERLIGNGFRVLKPPKTATDDIIKWSIRAPMYNENRSNATSCALNGKVYVIGGSHTAMNSVERYDPIINQWTKMPDLLRRRNMAAAVVLNGHIYVIGGTDGTSLLDSVEVFDEEANSWTEMHNSLNTARKAHAAVAWKGGILIAGGLCSIPLPGMESENMVSNSVEFFNPVRNTWIVFPSMEGVRCLFSMIVVDEDVLAIGGLSTNENSLTTVERFDGVAWRRDSFLKLPRGQFQTCLLRNWPNVTNDETEHSAVSPSGSSSLGRITKVDWNVVRECEDCMKQ